MKGEKRLGTGLGAIFGDDLSMAIEAIQSDAQHNGGSVELPVDRIFPNPYQPRKEFDQKALEELADSIRDHGVFTPILVKEIDSGYVLIAGERRLRASKLAGLEKIPAIVKEFSDEQMMEISLLENIQREDLTAIEEANSYEQLIHKLGYTQEQLAKRIGKSREHVANQLRLLRLPQEVQKMVSDKVLSMGQVRPLITLENDKTIVELANKIKKEGLSVRQVEKMVKNEKKSGFEKAKNEVLVDTALLNVQRIIQERLSTTVAVTDHEIRIRYSDVDDLNRILEIIDCLDN
ncbi:MAG: ParB/RepB/Spo0J family partition protein [Erysipelotrichaceae bacterium]|nr:ParB/RepB/Spo0J family partition protein [Erysipelotrichaceae bacterium]